MNLSITINTVKPMKSLPGMKGLKNPFTEYKMIIVSFAAIFVGDSFEWHLEKWL